MANLGVLRANVRRNLGETSAQFYQNTDLNQFIGEGYRRYFMTMVNEGDGYFETTTNFALVAGTEAIALGALNPPFFRISAVEKNTPQGTVPLEASQRRYTPNPTFFNGIGPDYYPSYKTRGMNLILEPAPAAAEAASSTSGIKFDYVYVPTFPSSASADGFEFDTNFPIVYEPMIELYATIAALEAKDGMGGVSDINSFRQRLAEWEERFNQSLSRVEIAENVAYVGESYGDDYFSF